MAHFAKLNENNIVIDVVVTDNNDPNGDEGYQWLINNLGGTWVKTSYNSVGGKRRNPNTGEILNEPGFRKNYASIGGIYDAQRDAFIPVKTFNSWILDEETCNWVAPIEYPSDGKTYVWNEESLSWVEVNI